MSPNPEASAFGGCRAGAGETRGRGLVSGTVWEGRRNRVRAPYAKTRAEVVAPVPEYHGTRGIPWESGGTTLQGRILDGYR